MLRIEQDGAVAVVHVDHGPVNAMDLELLEGIAATFTELDDTPEVGAVVLTGNGRAFGAGADLRRLLDGDPGDTGRFLEALSAAFLATLRCRAATVAAVDGHAIAGGAVLAAACDRVIGVDDPRVRIGLAELAVGVPFPAAAIEIVRRRLGPRLAEAVLTARTYRAPEAHAVGFLDELVARDELLGHARDTARTLAAVPRETMAITKEQLRAPIEAALAATGAAWDRRVVDAWAGEPVRTAMAAFVERTLGPRSG